MAEKRKKRLAPTPKGVAAYAWVHKPDTGHKYSDNKHKVTLVMDGDVDLTKFDADAIAAFRDEFPDNKVKDDEIKLPHMDGDDHKNEEFKGKILLTAKSKFPPQVIDSKRKPLKKGLQVRSGDLVRLVINYYPYEKTEKVKEGKKMVNVTIYGVSAQLQTVQLIDKRAGGGGADLLDDEDGFTNEDWDGPATARDPSDEDDADGDDADY